jgi:hypothetical protein
MSVYIFPDVVDTVNWQRGRKACFRTTITMDDSTLLASFAFGSCALILLAHHLSTSRKAKGLPLPPGPKTSWFGGIQPPKSHQWLTYARWKGTFGSVQSTLIIRCALTQ